MSQMSERELHGIWNYFLCLEGDLSDTSRYIEPEGQENVHSFEFAKLLILACTEVESVFKAICLEITETNAPGDIGGYKGIILNKYPKIVNAEVVIKRLGRQITPFAGWDTGSLGWWDSYQHVKHSRGSHFKDATYSNAVTALSALYILIFYLAEIAGIEFENYTSKYIDSDYSSPHLLCQPFKKLPDYEDT